MPIGTGIDIGGTKGEYGNLLFVANPKTCTVSFRDSAGVRHSVEVGAETLYEAAVLALRSKSGSGIPAAGFAGCNE